MGRSATQPTASIYCFPFIHHHGHREGEEATTNRNAMAAEMANVEDETDKLEVDDDSADSFDQQDTGESNSLHEHPTCATSSVTNEESNENDNSFVQTGCSKA